MKSLRVNQLSVSLAPAPALDVMSGSALCRSCHGRAGCGTCAGLHALPLGPQKGLSASGPSCKSLCFPFKCSSCQTSWIGPLCKATVESETEARECMHHLALALIQQTCSCQGAEQNFHQGTQICSKVCRHQSCTAGAPRAHQVWCARRVPDWHHWDSLAAHYVLGRVRNQHSCKSNTPLGPHLASGRSLGHRCLPAWSVWTGHVHPDRPCEACRHQHHRAIRSVC